MLALASKGITELMKKALITGHHYHSTGMQVTLSIMQPSAESSLPIPNSRSAPRTTNFF
jgi:hypothetical protein